MAKTNLVSDALLINEKEFETYKTTVDPVVAIPLKHVGVPEDYPCYAATVRVVDADVLVSSYGTLNLEGTNEAIHTFFYPEQAERLVYAFNGLTEARREEDEEGIDARVTATVDEEVWSLEAQLDRIESIEELNKLKRALGIQGSGLR